jgi:hypothetical protein
MNKFLALLFSLFLATGCAAIASALPVIDTALSDTSLVLKGIETTFDAYQQTHPVTPEDRAAYELLLANAYHDLTLGERAVADLKQVDQGQYDAAFKDFGAAFTALTAFLKQKGITPIGSGLVGVGTQGGDDFPVPRVIGLRIQS